MINLLIGVIFLVVVGAAVYAWLRKLESDRKFAAVSRDTGVQIARHISEIARLEGELKKLERLQHIPGVLERAKKTEQETAQKIIEAQRRADDILAAATLKAHRAIIDLDKEISRSQEVARDVIHNAEARAASIEYQARAQAEELRLSAGAEAKKSLSEASAKAREKTRKADQKLVKAEEAISAATEEALRIRQDAQKRAEEIAGKAYRSLERAEFYESVAEAMENAVEGYGERYMVSGATVLDELAEEYGFHNAGKKLGMARETIRLMEKNRTAATCGYEEGYKRDFAINFVLDAFNGKVSEILGKLKNNNYGTLRKQIRDAFALVNHNASALRDTRITREYLDARLNELKWAEAVRQLKIQERDEQKAIREQLREEEKAKREYEKAIKQAQRDEDLLTKALEKARREYEGASGEERAKYEARLRDLAGKLAEAEEKNKRAISMAQQTKCGHVYVISNIGSFGENVYKIGLTRRLEPMDRVRELGDASVPFSFDVHTLIYSEDAPALETALHKRFAGMQVNKANRRKEFFRVGLQDIRGVVEEMDPNVKWTMTAEAQQYRETLALEKAMQDDPEIRNRWLADQMNYVPIPVPDEDEAEEEQGVLAFSEGDA